MRGLARGLAANLGTAALFNQSQAWAGFDHAYVVWRDAVEKWVEDHLPTDAADWPQRLAVQRDRWLTPGGPADDGTLREMLSTYCLRRTFFLEGLWSPKASDPDWFAAFAQFMPMAADVRDEGLFKALAELVKRKPSVAGGARDLRFKVLAGWVPAGWWAYSTAGVAQDIRHRFPKDDWDGPEGSLRNVIYTLELWRPLKPLYWGVASNGRLAPMR